MNMSGENAGRAYAGSMKWMINLNAMELTK